MTAEFITIEKLDDNKTPNYGAGTHRGRATQLTMRDPR